VETFGLHPTRMNLDAVFPLYKTGNLFAVHHAHNVGLTAEYLNRSKSNDVPLVLATAADAIRMTDKGSDLAKLSQLELAFDHYFRINITLPWSRAKRIRMASKQTQAWWQRISRMLKSGVYDGCEATAGYTIRPHLSTAYGTGAWDAETIVRLDGIVTAIENSLLYNPTRLVLPRSKSGAPWLWNPAHMFDDHDWAFLAPVFEHMFSRLDESSASSCVPQPRWSRKV
jgi:hypothetical protein